MLCGKGRVRTQDLGYQSGALCPLHYTPSKYSITCLPTIYQSNQLSGYHYRASTTTSLALFPCLFFSCCLEPQFYLPLWHVFCRTARITLVLLNKLRAAAAIWRLLNHTLHLPLGQHFLPAL